MAAPMTSTSGQSRTGGLIVAILVALICFNATIAVPVGLALSKDERNVGFTMIAHRSFGVHPTEITIDLLSADGAAPIDLYRGLFQAAEALEGRHFDKVILARRGSAVFVMDGADFAMLGSSFASGENPIYLIRTLPEQLYLPDGTQAFESWSGGFLGVLGAQMQDVNDAARMWAGE